MHKATFFKLASLSLLAALLLGACTSAAAPTSPPEPSATPLPPATVTPEPASQAISLQDGMGHQVDLAGPAQRIVSLAPSNTEILFAIGAGEQVAGRDMFSDYPQAAQQVPDIGGGYGDLNTELIVSQHPDLVLAAELTPPEQIKALQDLGLKVFLLKNPTQLDGMYTNLVTVGQLTGHVAEAEKLVESLKTRVAAVESKVANVAQRPVVFYELDSTDPNAPYTAGPGTFIDTLIHMAGGTNLGGELSSDYPQINVEELITKDPDLIVLGDATWGGVTPEDVKARAGWETLSAVKNDKVVVFDDNLVSRPGPRLVDGLEQMARLLHPELFK